MYQFYCIKYYSSLFHFSSHTYTNSLVSYFICNSACASLFLFFSLFLHEHKDREEIYSPLFQFTILIFSPHNQLLIIYFYILLI